MNRYAWMKRAACIGQWSLFFPEDGEQQAERESRELRAKAICAPCPVREPCLVFALRKQRQYDDVGIWGGTNEAERTHIRRTRSRRVCIGQLSLIGVPA